MDIDENLGSYWECLTGTDQKRWFTKECHLQKRLNISTVDRIGFESLRTRNRKKKYISNICNYDILQNLGYADQFFYSQMAIRKENETSDFISRLIYLGEDRVDRKDASDTI